MAKRILSVLLLSAAFPMAAMAQTAAGQSGTTITNPGSAADQNAQDATTPKPMDQSADASATTEGPFVTVPETGAWRVSDFEGKSVYGADGESIGEINDVLVSQDGSVNAVIIGVGGFLGIGEKDVLVDWSALEITRDGKTLRIAAPTLTREVLDAAATVDIDTLAPDGK